MSLKSVLIVTVAFLSRVPLVIWMHTFVKVLIELLMMYSAFSKAMSTSGKGNVQEKKKEKRKIVTFFFLLSPPHGYRCNA